MLLELKKDIEIKPNNVGGSYTIFKKEESILSVIYGQLVPFAKTLNIQIGAFDQEGNHVNNLQAGNLSIYKGKVQIGNESIGDDKAFDQFYPEITKKGLDYIKRMTFNGATLGEYIK